MREPTALETAFANETSKVASSYPSTSRLHREAEVSHFMTRLSIEEKLFNIRDKDYTWPSTKPSDVVHQVDKQSLHEAKSTQLESVPQVWDILAEAGGENIALVDPGHEAQEEPLRLTFKDVSRTFVVFFLVIAADFIPVHNILFKKNPQRL